MNQHEVWDLFAKRLANLSAERYYAGPFPAPDWRAPYTEAIDDASEPPAQ